MAAMLRARACGEPQAGAAADAADGAGGDRPAPHQQAGGGAQDLSLPAAGLTIERPNQVWAPTSPISRWRRAFCTWWRSWTGRAVRCWRGACRTRWTRLLRRGAGGGARAVRPAGDLQHRSGQPVHQRGFTGMLKEAGIRITMDGRGRWMDNVFIERLWRILKYEEVYLNGYADGREARAGIARLAAPALPIPTLTATASRTCSTTWPNGPGDASYAADRGARRSRRPSPRATGRLGGRARRDAAPAGRRLATFLLGS